MVSEDNDGALSPTEDLCRLAALYFEVNKGFVPAAINKAA